MATAIIPQADGPPTVWRGCAVAAWAGLVREAPGRATKAARMSAFTTRSMEKVRISKLMSERGLCSRREADSYIERGWVRVDGEVVSELGAKAYPSQAITLERAAQAQQRQRVTILIHKPMGYVSGQAEDGYQPAAVL